MLMIGYIGNGKSINCYYFFFLLNWEYLNVKMIYV